MFTQALRFRLFIRLLAVCVALHSAGVRSNPLESLLGVGARAKAMGATGSVLAQDYSAVYANPAGLSWCGGNRVTLGYHHLASHLHLHTEQQLKEEPLQFGRYDRMHMGLCFPLPLRLSLGVLFESGFLEPAQMRVQSQNPQPQFVLYGTPMKQPSVLGGLSLRLVRGLSAGIGVGSTVSSRIDTDITVKGMQMDVDVQGDLSPSLLWIAGMRYEPVEGWRLALVYRHRTFSQFTTNLKPEVTLGSLSTGDMIRATSDIKLSYAPMQVALGVLLSPLKVLRLALELTWMRWSDYQSPFPENKTSLKFIEDKFDVLPFQNTFVPRVGVEYTWRELVSLRSGYSYHQAIITPSTDTDTNVLDGDTHFFTFGGGYQLLRLKKAQIGLDVFGIVGRMSPTSVDKPGRIEPNRYDFGGIVWDTGLSIDVKY